VQVPLEVLAGENFDLVTTELFGPFQVVVTYADEDLPTVLESLERMTQHLTAAVVSADIRFQNRVLAATVNGTTYCGMRARTTGAPQNHWFGPCGDPRAAGIGTAEAIIQTWSGHREIIMDQGSESM
jgi:1-pyrroline-5-carboxylate dehydrogenase